MAGTENIQIPEQPQRTRIDAINVKPLTTPELRTAIVDDIKANGPLPFQDYMSLALYHPTAGYYPTNAVLAERRGQARGTADFITHPVLYSPEFGAGIADMAAMLSKKSETTEGITQVVSIASGNGRLDRDFLDHLKQQYPTIYDALKYTIVEISPKHADIIRKTLGEHVNKVTIIQADATEFLENPPFAFDNTFIVSNEWPDTMPVQPYVLDEQGIWRQQVVQLSEDDHLVLGLGNQMDPNSFATYYKNELTQRFGPLQFTSKPTIQDVLDAIRDAGILDIPKVLSSGTDLHLQLAHALANTLSSYTPRIIVNEGLERVAAALKKHSAARNLYVLTIDYGSGVSLPSTSVRFYYRDSDHFTDQQLLDMPGIADITTDIDFARFAEAHGLPTLVENATDVDLIYQTREAAGTNQTRRSVRELAISRFTGQPSGRIVDALEKAATGRQFLAEFAYTGSGNQKVATVWTRAHTAYQEISHVERVCGKLGIPDDCLTESIRKMITDLIQQGIIVVPA